MADKTINSESEHLECELCMNEIPLSEAKSSEATDYVVNYCGIDCYDQWRQTANSF